MSQSVVKKIILGKDERGRDISDLIGKLSFTRSVKQEDVLEMTANNSNAEQLLELREFDKGKPVIFNYGFISGSMSKTYTAIITDIEADYVAGKGLTVSVRALSKGVTLKRISTNRIWKKVDTAQIVKEIAEAHGLTAVIQDMGGFITWDSLPQGGMTDFTFLQKLASMERDGLYEMYISGNTLYFSTRSTGTESLTHIVVGETSTVHRFTIKYREATLNKAAGEVTSTTHEAQAKINAVTESTQTALGKFKVDAATGKITDQDGKPIMGNSQRLTPKTLRTIKEVTENKSVTFQDVKDASAEVLEAGVKGLPEALNHLYTMGSNSPASSPYANTIEVLNRANHKHKRARRKVLGAVLIEYGNTGRDINTVLTVSGVADRFVGNWFVEEVRDDVDSEFKTTSTLGKDGLKRGTVKAPKSNETVGSKQGGQSSVIVTATSRDEQGVKLKGGETYKVEEGKMKVYVSPTDTKSSGSRFKKP